MCDVSIIPWWNVRYVVVLLDGIHHIWFVSIQLSPFFIHPLNSSPVSFHPFFLRTCFFCLHSTRFAYAVICLSWYYIWIYINLYTFYLSYHIISALQFYFRFRFIYTWIRFFSSSLLCVDFCDEIFLAHPSFHSYDMWANAIYWMDIVDARCFSQSVLFFRFYSWVCIYFTTRKLACYLHQIPPIEFECWMFVICCCCCWYVLAVLRPFSLPYCVCQFCFEMLIMFHATLIKFLFSIHGTFFSRLSIKYIDRLSVIWHVNRFNIAFIGLLPTLPKVWINKKKAYHQHQIGLILLQIHS